MSITQWFEQAQQGDKAAFGQFQLALDADVRRFIWHLIGYTPNEDDIVQNSFLALYVNIRRMDSFSGARAFLLRVVRNQCYDHLRRQGRYKTVSLHTEFDDPLPLLDHRPGPDDATHWLMLYQEVQQAIKKLPETHRQTFILYHEMELSYAEIAQVLGISIGTVKSRMFHARKLLLALLHPDLVKAIQQYL